MSYMKKYKRKFDIFKVILDKTDPVIIEIGAHYGEDTLRFLEVFPDCTVYCFEPDPRNIKIFKKYVDSDKVKLFETALCEENGEAKFFQSFKDYTDRTVPDKYDWISIEDYQNEKLNNSGSSSLKRGYAHTLDNYVVVETERFDEWHSRHNVGEVDLVWLDVQGAERDVLSGMGDAIKNIKFIWTEYGEKTYEGAMSRVETINFMRKRNFSVINELSSKSPTGDLLFRRNKCLRHKI